jgi:hypothetical protein
MEDTGLRPAIAAGLVLLLTSCESMTLVKESASSLTSGVQAVIDRKVGQLIHYNRGRGNKMLKSAADTVSAESCQSRRLPFFRLISSEVHPPHVKGGESFNHRFTYALCPKWGGKLVNGRLTKLIAHGGDTILAETKEEYPLQPGTWADDDDIQVPPNAPKGQYTIGIEIVVNGIASHAESEFQIN